MIHSNFHSSQRFGLLDVGQLRSELLLTTSLLTGFCGLTHSSKSYRRVLALIRTPHFAHQRGGRPSTNQHLAFACNWDGCGSSTVVQLIGYAGASSAIVEMCMVQESIRIQGCRMTSVYQDPSEKLRHKDTTIRRTARNEDQKLWPWLIPAGPCYGPPPFAGRVVVSEREGRNCISGSPPQSLCCCKSVQYHSAETTRSSLLAFHQPISFSTPTTQYPRCSRASLSILSAPLHQRDSFAKSSYSLLSVEVL